MVIFVLVHGGFHGAWCFSYVIARLENYGHRAIAPTLSGLGERAHLADRPINLTTHIEDIIDVIERDNLRDVILCGHSYAGLVITGVAGRIPGRIKILVDLDAMVPRRDNESAIDILGPERAMVFMDRAGDTGMTVKAMSAEYYGVHSADAEWVNKTLTPHPVGCFLEKLRLTGKEDLVSRRTFVLCEQHHTINHATYARLKELPDWKTISINSAHDLMITDPDLFCEVLLAELKG